MEKTIQVKVVLVKRRSRLDDLVARFNSVSQARFYIEHLGADFSDYQKEHDEYSQSIGKATECLSRLTRVHVLDRSYLPNFLFGEDDIVVAVGQDGLVANTMKYLSGQPLIGVNPDPRRWDGVLLPFTVGDLSRIIPEVMKKQRKHKEVTMATAALNNGQILLAVNDLFIGQKTHISARYQIRQGDKKENQSSSGIIVSTGLGSTGWLKSVMTGAAGVASSITRKSLKINTDETFGWDSDYLYYSVREPFPSQMTGTKLVFGKVYQKKPLCLLSQMAENGVIFSDGMEEDFLEFNSGTEAVITVADRKGNLVV